MKGELAANAKNCIIVHLAVDKNYFTTVRHTSLTYFQPTN